MALGCALQACGAGAEDHVQGGSSSSGSERASGAGAAAQAGTSAAGATAGTIASGEAGEAPSTGGPPHSSATSGGGGMPGVGGTFGSGGVPGIGGADAFVEVPDMHWRLSYEITRGRVTLLGAQRLDGMYRGGTLINGQLVFIALAYGVPRWIQTITDPRVVEDRVWH